MGCGSRAGKMEQHSSGKCVVNEELCRGCRKCAKECGSDAITYENNKAVIHEDLCKGCGRCIGACSYDAIRNEQWDAGDLLDRKMAEYAQAVVQDRPCFHINIVRDISPNCDCHPENDVPIVPDVGMFASADPVALDLACAEAINRQPVLPNSAITDLKHEHDCDRFHAAHDNTHWQDLIEHGKKLGIGQDTYELVTIR